jgi:hypothetical protein
MSYSVKTPDDGQRNCPKHVEFYSKNKFEKLFILVGFIIRIFQAELQVWYNLDVSPVYEIVTHLVTFYSYVMKTKVIQYGSYAGEEGLL